MRSPAAFICGNIANYDNAPVLSSVVFLCEYGHRDFETFVAPIDNHQRMRMENV